jgi:hypothetical protein
VQTRTDHTVSRTGSLSARKRDPHAPLSRFSRLELTVFALSVVALSLSASACSSGERNPGDDSGIARAQPDRSGSLADTLAKVCTNAERGSVLVARPDPAEEESQVSFKLLGDGAGSGVVLCRNELYAQADTLLALMGEPGKVSLSDGRAVLDERLTQIPAYLHEGKPYVELAPFARSRQALLVQRTEHRMDATLWPKATLLFLKELGPSRRGLYDSAVRAGLLPE